jgi:hypothetical protein
MKLRIGGRYLIDGYPATVVVIVDQDEYDPDHPAGDWSNVLTTGILVRDDQAGLIHYPDLEDIRIEELP